MFGTLQSSINPSLRRDPKTQRRKRTPSVSTVSGDAGQKWDTNLCEYPLPEYSLYVSASTCDPPEIATRDAELPTAATTDPSTVTSWVASTVKQSTTSTATRRKVPFSHVRESPQWLATLLELKALKMMSLCPPNISRQNSWQHSSNDNWLKAKQQCESGMRRRGSGNLRNLPKIRLESRQLHASLAQRLAQTAPTVSQWDRSCLPSSTHLPGRTPSSGPATEGRSHQLRRRSSPLQTDALSPVPQEDPSESFPSPTPAHLWPMDFLENPARATQVSQDANAGHGQSDDAPENAATLHGAHVWVQTHSCGTTGNKSGWACWQHLTAPSQKTSWAPLPRKPFSSGRFSSTEHSGAPHLHLSRLRWCPTSPLYADSVRVPVLAGPAPHSALPTEKRKLWPDTKLLNPKRRKILTIHQRRQQLSLLLLANGATQGHHLMPSGTHQSGSGIGHELICKRKNMVKTWSRLGTILVNSSFEHKNYHHQMPALIAPCFGLDCGQPQGHHAGTSQPTVPGSW